MPSQLMSAWCVSFFTILFTIQISQAQKPVDWSDREIIVRETEESERQGNERISLKSGYPLSISGLKYAVPDSDPEDQARSFIMSHARQLGISERMIEHELVLGSIRNGLSGKVVRLNQYYQGFPVYRGQITIHINNEQEVTFLANAIKYNIDQVLIDPKVTLTNALEGALTQTGVRRPTTFLKEEWIIFPYGDQPRLAIRQILAGADATGEWEVITDGTTGQILKAKNNSFNCKWTHSSTTKPIESSPPFMMANGNGNVFDPDPLSSAGATYGDPGYVDNSDNTSVQLDLEMQNVVLQDITLDMGMHQLKGPWAEIIDFEAPFKGTFEQASSTFNFNRMEDGFEAVNVYYHIDASMRYLNNTLGLSIMPYQYIGGVKADPSGQNGSDNSQYQSGQGRLTFGEGGVDDAEDSDVIHHELGHGLHDWVTMGSLSQVNGLSEGSGDYWAASYNRSLGDWTPSDEQYYWVFNWDGHNQFWSGRSTDYRPAIPPYPNGLTGSIHTDGQIWATCMLDVWEVLGKDKTDMIFWEGLGMTNSMSSQDDAANAVYQAALDMGYSRAELEQVHIPLTSCGYTLPPLPLRDCTATELDLSGAKTTNDDYVASETIISSQQISNAASILFQAADHQILEFPFEVIRGSDVRFVIEDCIQNP